MPVIEITITKSRGDQAGPHRAADRRCDRHHPNPGVRVLLLIHELERESIGRAGRTCADIMSEMGR